MKANGDGSEETGLNRTIGFPGLLVYGLGTMVGGGFYALTGKVAGLAGAAAPLAFLFAGLLAAVNAFTFAELSARHPFSAGEARYVQEGFGRRRLSQIVGWMVITTGIVSAATLVVATIAFLRDLAPIPEFAGIVVLVLAMGLIAAWGIGQSVLVVAGITVIEVGALLFVLVLAGDHLADVPDRIGEIAPIFSAGAWVGIVSAAFLGFYAFIGFEDMVNMAEEVKDVRRTLPKAIFGSVLLATLLYVLVSLAAVMAVDPKTLAAASTPLAVVVGGSEGGAGVFLTAVSLLTGVNGALVQIVMASRVGYGLARRSQAPGWLGDIHPKTRTPVKGTALVSGIILILALFFPVTTLAEVTSGIMLAIFALLNASLWRMKRRGDPLPDGVRGYPLFIPVIGLAACLAVLIFKLVAVMGGG